MLPKTGVGKARPEDSSGAEKRSPKTHGLGTRRRGVEKRSPEDAGNEEKANRENRWH